MEHDPPSVAHSIDEGELTQGALITVFQSLSLKPLAPQFGSRLFHWALHQQQSKNTGLVYAAMYLPSILLSAFSVLYPYPLLSQICFSLLLSVFLLLLAIIFPVICMKFILHAPPPPPSPTIQAKATHTGIPSSLHAQSSRPELFVQQIYERRARLRCDEQHSNHQFAHWLFQ